MSLVDLDNFLLQKGPQQWIYSTCKGLFIKRLFDSPCFYNVKYNNLQQCWISQVVVISRIIKFPSHCCYPTYKKRLQVITENLNA